MSPESRKIGTIYLAFTVLTFCISCCVHQPSLSLLEFTGFISTRVTCNKKSKRTNYDGSTKKMSCINDGRSFSSMIQTTWIYWTDKKRNDTWLYSRQLISSKSQIVDTCRGRPLITGFHSTTFLNFVRMNATWVYTSKTQYIPIIVKARKLL